MDEIGVEWRETNFLRTLRLRTERSGNSEAYEVDNSIFTDVTRLALVKGGIAINEHRDRNKEMIGTDINALSSKDRESSSSSSSISDGRDGDSGEWKWLPMPSQKSAVLNEGFWSLILQDEAIVDPSLLFVNFPLLDGISPGSFQQVFVCTHKH